MSSANVQSLADRNPAQCMETVIAWVEAFAGVPQAGDWLMLVSRYRKDASRFGQAVFLRDEIDAGTVHGLFPLRRGGVAPLLTKLAAKTRTPLRLDDDFWLSGALTRVDGAGDSVLVAVDPAAIADIQATARALGLTLSRVGDFHLAREPVSERLAPVATDTVQAAFWARRRFWRESMSV